MADRNIHGLGRNIPTHIREAVRKRCGFGCVLCGLAFYDYEHFDPDFKDAHEHNVDGITLLCMQHNQRRNRKTLSVESVRAANLNPYCLKQGFASETFDLGSDPIQVVFAGCTFTDCDHILLINGISILSVLPPQNKGEPYLLSGIFSDSDGLTTLRIADNVFSVGSENWDVECVGPRIIIKKGKKDISLILRAEPPHRVIIEKIDMEFEGWILKGDENLLTVSSDTVAEHKFKAMSIKSAYAAIGLGQKR